VFVLQTQGDEHPVSFKSTGAIFLLLQGTQNMIQVPSNEQKKKKKTHKKQQVSLVHIN